jgi:hypothetical protein
MTFLTVADALCRARAAVDEHWNERSSQGATPGEEELTIRLLMGGSPEIKYEEFNRAEEGRLGADWLWWFVSQDGECFGVLLQAKKLKKAGKKWSVGLGHLVRSSKRLQITTLLDAAEHFDVPAAYILYCGDLDYRQGLDCGVNHDERTVCERCLRSGVSVLSGPCAKHLFEYSEPGDAIFRASRPLEEIVLPAREPVFDLNLEAIHDDLKRLLIEPQTEARAVAKHLFAQAAKMRLGHHAMGGTALLEQIPAGEHVFDEYPIDRGHFGLNYYAHVLRGLRRSLPSDVTPLTVGDSLDPGDFPSLGGVVIVQFP